ncbi:hypothetical protein IPC371_18840 [Pseudomonas aeruginosa]|uniref:hypothetical protein n=1 Tax=Pseudomonas aeruginosa TaxID=287 RepID=UPI000F894883|nr:hypothetical protein [Pseudomonas aeruginosa]RUJ17969.1 hypothetical protein IPC371_18840 [Pseudomonas aeruginosa]
MTKANECTCPSGDGSLRHPCPAHPAVEQAGGDERAAFRPAQVISYRPGMGEVTIYVAGRVPGYMNIGDTVYVSDRAPVEQPSAALAQPSPVRSSLLINGYQLRAALEFIAPDGTAKQLESEARIEWRQQDADFLEAGLYAWCAEYPEEGCVLLDEEPATAQPSPASDLAPFNLAPHAEAFNEAPDEALKPDQAEAERPEVVGYRSKESGMVYEQDYGLKNPEALTTVAECERIVGALRAENAKLIEALDESDGDRWRLRSERDAALARVAELEMLLRKLSTNGLMQFSTADEEMAVQAALGGAPVAQAGQVPQAWLDVQAERRRQVEVEGYHGFRDSHYINYELSKAARGYIEVSWHALSGGLPCKKPESWPWMAGFKWADGRTMLVKAGALILAEIERLDRAGVLGKEVGHE